VKTSYIGVFSLLILFVLVAFSSCFSPWKGDDGAITIIISGGISRNAGGFSDEEISGFTHTISIKNGPGADQTGSITGTGQIRFIVAPGYWDIHAEARNDDHMVVAEGSALRVLVKPGENNAVQIKMGPAADLVDTAFIIDLWVNEEDGEILSSGDAFLISAYNPNLPDSFTARVNGEYEMIQWYLWGFPLAGSENQPEITIYAEDYPIGAYQLLVIVFSPEGVPYSTEITFEVAGGVN